MRLIDDTGDMRFFGQCKRRRSGFCYFAPKICLSLPWTEKAPTIKGRGKLAERLEVEFGPFRPASSRRAEMLLAYIYRSITHRVHFLDKAIGDLFICAKDLFVGANGGLGAQRPRKLCAGA